MTTPSGLSLDVVILCGGKGSRLQSVVSDRPKSMATLRGRPFLEWQLLSLREKGFRNIILCTGFMGLSIREYFEDGAQLGLEIRYSDEPVARGTGGAIRSALALLQTDPVVVLNGDSWCNVDLERQLRFHEEHHALGTLALTTVTDPQRYGHVELGQEGEVIQFCEKGQITRSGWINAGMYILSQSLIARVPEHSCISLEYDVFPNWVARGLYGYSGEYQFFDIGTPVSYADAEKNFEKVFHMPQEGLLAMSHTG